jgi:hypothetical protein
VQLGAFIAVLYVSPVQAAQVRFVVALPSLATDCPATQFVRAPHGVAGFPSWSQVLPPQVNAGVVPPAQYSPGLHASHTGADMLVPAALCSVPAAHMPCGRHIIWFGSAEYSPIAQGMHARLTAALPAVLT